MFHYGGIDIQYIKIIINETYFFSQNTNLRVKFRYSILCAVY